MNLLTVLSKEDGGDNILRWIPMNQLVSVLQTSKATNQITRTHITRRVQGGRSQMLRLFQDDGALFDVYKLIDCATPGEITIYSHPYDENKPVAALRAGHFLAFVAVAILNDCDALCFGMFGKRAKSWEYGVVVVTALVVHGVHRHLIIALNGGSDRCRKIYEDYCTAAKFLELIGVHSVHVVHNSDPPHKSLVSFVGEHALTKEQLERWLLDSSEHGGQDWHGEQKILQYIGDTFGFDMKKFVLCLGISHLAGPCTDDTTATQHCKEFLEAMRRSDVSFVGREAGHVMGFWLGGGSHSRKLNPIYKLFFRLLE